jgi:hypothetical protein
MAGKDVEYFDKFKSTQTRHCPLAPVIKIEVKPTLIYKFGGIQHPYITHSI